MATRVRAVVYGYTPAPGYQVPGERCVHPMHHRQYALCPLCSILLQKIAKPGWRVSTGVAMLGGETDGRLGQV